MTMVFEHNKRNFRRLGATLAVLFGLVLAVSDFHFERQEVAQTTWADFPVTPPDSIPKPSQESIELAMTMFGIKVPVSASRPVYDPLVRDRGLTIRRGWFSQATVVIGPSAFSSWALLGSTLAHELEVHCTQNFMMISLMDKLGMDGTGTAEREAYLHELRFAQRFQMDQYDYRLITETMEYYYPETRKNTQMTPKLMTQSFGRWLARKLINPASSN